MDVQWDDRGHLVSVGRTFAAKGKSSALLGSVPVSYTHLDVYKRQSDASIIEHDIETAPAANRRLNEAFDIAFLGDVHAKRSDTVASIEPIERTVD